ncbi:hypothetical protein [Paenibacillus kribbensis]|nr:hypothetical protein [Paenibacillus kribbensis]
MILKASYRATAQSDGAMAFPTKIFTGERKTLVQQHLACFVLIVVY